MWDHDLKMPQEYERSDAASAKLSELFPESDWGLIRRLLKEVGFPGSRRATDRIHRDVLRLRGGDIGRFTQALKVAKADPRDLFMAAEHGHAEYELKDQTAQSAARTVVRAIRLDHIQIAAPEGCEAAARQFYGEVLGMKELEKPAVLRARGGCWFQCGGQQLHIGVERDFRPAKKAHPAFAVDDLDGLRDFLHKRGATVIDDEAPLDSRRFYAEDPWGNRLEFIESLK
jgi:catechol 2,3-dioxygenase-like lactoylglutathione lyase family enzyme